MTVYIHESLDNVEASVCTSQNQVWQHPAHRECLDSIVDNSGDECHPTLRDVKECCHWQNSAGVPGLTPAGSAITCAHCMHQQ